MNDSGKTICAVYGLSVILAFAYFSFDFIKKNDFVTFIFFGELVPAAKSVVWPYYALKAANENGPAVSRGTETAYRPPSSVPQRLYPTAAQESSRGSAGKKNSIAKEDAANHASFFEELLVSYLNEACKTDQFGNFLPPNIDNVEVPYILRMYFSDSAIRNYIYSLKLQNARQIMIDLLNRGNLSWKARTQPWCSIELTFYNNAPVRVKEMDIYISGLDRTYTLSTLGSVAPKSDGILSTVISADTYRLISSQGARSRITRVGFIR